MTSRILLMVLAVCLLALGFGCRETKQQQEARRRQRRKLESLMEKYNPKKVPEYLLVKKGTGEGEKVKVYISPSKRDLVIGQLNFGTYVQRLDEYRGWWAIRYYSRDGGEFFGWIQLSQAEYKGSVAKADEVIQVEEEHKKAHLTLQESDDEMLEILKVPYVTYQRDPEDRPKKRFHGGGEPEGYDDISLLSRVTVTSETKLWASQRMKELVELSHRADQNYVPIIQAYYYALDWYVKGEKGRFTQQLGTAQDKRAQIARYFH